jgi:hypothetical protein
MSTIRFAADGLPGEFQRPLGWFWDAVTSPARAMILRLDSTQGVVRLRATRCARRWSVDPPTAGGLAHDWADNVRMLSPNSVLACRGGRLGRPGRT